MELKLGENKTVKLSPWVGKTKRDFMRLFKEKGEKVSEQDVVDILVYPFIEPKDVWYSSEEMQYIVISLRELSIKDEIVFAEECHSDSCNKIVDIKTDISNIYQYFPNHFPIKDGKFEWKDLIGADSIKQTASKNSDIPQGEIDILLHIKSYDSKEITSFSEILEIADNMSLQETDDMSDSYIRNKSMLTLMYEQDCECGYKNKYTFDTIPSFFDPLLPKEIKDKI